MKESHHVLYVDDERNNLIVFRHAFHHRFSVLTALSGAEALDLMAKRSVAVLLTDKRMPGMSGLELCEKVRRLHPHVVRLLITAFQETELENAALKSGSIQRVILKPWDVDSLGALIEKALASFMAE